MIGRTNAGGGGLNIKDYAISVTFPVGSECTCTNGAKTLKSNGALAGAWIFPVYPGTWTVTITDGEASKSETVVISEYNKSVHIGIGYELYAIKNGLFKNGITWTVSAGKIVEGPPNLVIDHGNTNCVFRSSAITIPVYAKTMHVAFSAVNVYDRIPISFLGAKVMTDFNTVNTPVTYTLDVSPLQGQTGAIGMTFPAYTNSSYQRHYISDIWFK